MNTDQMIRTLREALPSLQKEFGVKRIGLFGSCARGSQTEASDVDIITEFRQPIGLRFVEFAERLERILGRRADVLTPAGVSGIRNRRLANSIAEAVIYV